MSATAKNCGITIATDCSQFALGFLLIWQKRNIAQNVWNEPMNKGCSAHPKWSRHCLVPRSNYSKRSMRFGSRSPSESFVSDTSPKCIDREGRGRRRTGIRQIPTYFDTRFLGGGEGRLLDRECLFEETRYLIKPSTKKKRIKLISVISRLPCRKAG